MRDTQQMRTPHPNARKLRKNMPPAERALWRCLRNRQLAGFRFRRQHAIAPYIVDFACLDARLVIELDGDQHGRGDAPTRDAIRDAAIEAAGFRIERFWNHEIAQNLNGVLETILRAAEENSRAARFSRSPVYGGAVERKRD